MSAPTQRARAPLAPATIVVGLVVALCALLLVKWLAVVALGALALAALVRWARRDRGGAGAVAGPAPAARPVTTDDCSWCGLSGGHRDLGGRPVRPRHAHRVA